MRAILILLCVISAVAMSGCGTRQIYEGLQNSQRMRCQKFPKPEYEECVERADASFEEYRKNRDELRRKQ